MEKPSGDQPQVPLTEEQIIKLEEIGIENARDMDPDEAREQLRLISWQPVASHEEVEEESEDKLEMEDEARIDRENKLPDFDEWMIGYPKVKQFIDSTVRDGDDYAETTSNLLSTFYSKIKAAKSVEEVESLRSEYYEYPYLNLVVRAPLDDSSRRRMNDIKRRTARGEAITDFDTESKKTSADQPITPQEKEPIKVTGFAELKQRMMETGRLPEESSESEQDDVAEGPLTTDEIKALEKEGVHGAKYMEPKEARRHLQKSAETEVELSKLDDNEEVEEVKLAGEAIVEAPLSDEEIEELRKLGVDEEGIELGKSHPNKTRHLIALSKPIAKDQVTDDDGKIVKKSEEKPSDIEKAPHRDKTSQSERLKSEIEGELKKPLGEMSEKELSAHLGWLNAQTRWPDLNNHPDLEQKIRSSMSQAAELINQKHAEKKESEGLSVTKEALEDESVAFQEMSEVLNPKEDAAREKDEQEDQPAQIPAVEEAPEDEPFEREPVIEEEEGSVDNEKYSKTFELRSQVKEMREARVALVDLEKEATSPLLIGNKKKEAVEKYEAAKQVYEQRRTEYVGEKAWRILKEKQKMAETEMEKHQEGRFEKFREGWRKLGDKNLDTWLTKKGKQPTSKAGKFLARMVSARAAIGLGLLGGGVLLGAGSAVGIGAIAARRVLAGTATGLGAYDLAHLASDKRFLKGAEIDIQGVRSLDDEDVEYMLAAFEARAKYSGKKFVESPVYQKLRLEYKRRIEGYDDRKETIKQALLDADKSLEEERGGAAWDERKRKAIGVAAGAVVGTGLLAKLFGNATRLGTLPEGVTLEEAEEAVKSGPTLPADTAQALAGEAGDTVSAPVAAEQIPASVDTTQVAAPANVLSENQIKDIEARASGDMAQSIKHEGEIGHEYIKDLGYTSTIEKGGSAWQAARELVDSGKITEADFNKAWASIANMGLTHEGDVVTYVPEAEGTAAHFKIIDNPNDGMKLGTHEDLAKEYDRLGKERPDWLKKLVGEKVAAAVSETASPAPATEMVTSSIDASGKTIFGHVDFADQMTSPVVEDSEPLIGPDPEQEMQRPSPSSAAEAVTPTGEKIVSVEPIKADFKRGFFGGINEVTITPTHPVTLKEVGEYLNDPSLNDIKLPKGVGRIEAVGQIQGSTEQLVLMRRVLDSLAQQGVTNTDEVKFLERNIAEIKKTTENLYGKIYKPNLFK